MKSVVRTRFIDFALFLGAWWLRVGWMGQLGARHREVRTGDLRSIRQVFDGHERLLFEAFAGQVPTPSPQAWPLSVAVHHVLGMCTEDPRALLWLAGTMGALSVVLVGVAVRRRWGVRAGLSAGLLVAVLPEHVAWSTSAVPVVHGLFCLTAAAVARGGAARAVWCALAAAFRPELALPALFLGTPGLAALAVAAGQVLWIGGPPGAPFLPVFRVNLPLLAFIGPATLGLALVNVRDKATASLAGLAIATHVVGATFSDYGARHALPAALALCALTASHLQRPWLPVMVGLGLLPELWDLRTHWQQPDDHPAAVVLHPASGDCVEITDEPPVPGQPRPSWVALVDETVTGPCVVWGEAPEHTEWSSRGLRDRSIRMRHTWTLVAVDSVIPGGGRPWRRRWQLTAGPGIRGTMGEAMEAPVR